MKKVIVFFIVPFFLFSCGHKNNFSISGKVEGGAGKKIYLNKLLLNTQQPLDSAKLDKEGRFKFSASAHSPSFYILKLSSGSFVTLLVDSAENCKVTAPYKSFSENYKVDGSVGSEYLRDLNSRFLTAKKQLDSVQAIYKKVQNDPLQSARARELELLSNSIKNNHSGFVTSFVKNNPFSLASVYALYQQWSENDYVIKDLQVMKIAASALFSVYPSNEQVVALYQNTSEIVREETNRKIVNALKEKAVNSPNIVLPDADGKTKELWSLHGKYVLVHFWSAKDPSSRIINPVLAEAYHKYSRKGFEIYMVSIDTDREAWMDAIQDYNLDCINVGDMKGSSQAVTNYNITSVPTNYLLDTQGEIIAKNLQGPALDQALSHIFK
jgi:thiol-disulfide isomerase/thioredoxin